MEGPVARRGGYSGLRGLAGTHTQGNKGAQETFPPAVAYGGARCHNQSSFGSAELGRTLRRHLTGEILTALGTVPSCGV